MPLHPTRMFALLLAATLPAACAPLAPANPSAASPAVVAAGAGSA